MAEKKKIKIKNNTDNNNNNREFDVSRVLLSAGKTVLKYFREIFFCLRNEE